MSSPNLRNLLIKVTDNWVAKALSVFLAVIIFVLYTENGKASRTILVDLNVEFPADLVPSSPTPKIRVTLQGEAGNITPIPESDIEAYLDLENIEGPGTYHVPVQLRKKGSALDVEVETSTNPVEVILELDRKISKSVPLKAITEGSVEPGYDITYSLSPNQVKVEGPAKLLEGVTELATETVDLNGRDTDFFKTVSILNLNPLLTIRENRDIEFRGVVRSRVAVRAIGFFPIVLEGLDRQFIAEPDVSFWSVKIEGPRAELDAFTPPEPFLSVDCSGITGEGTYILPVKVNLPPSLKLVREEPQEVTVAVSRAELPAEGPVAAQAPAGTR